MTVEKRGNKWCTISCHHDPGKVIACFDTESEADAQHRSFYVKKVEININELN